MPDLLTLRTYFVSGCSQFNIKAMSASILLLFTVGCVKERSLPVELSMTVTPTTRPGVYTISGNTNLPDQSQIVVQGIRPLTSPTQPMSTNASSNYAVLDRQTTKAVEGKWQATLKLWQIAPDGQYRESWQQRQTQLSQLQPSSDVVFVAVIDPANQSKALAQQLEKQGKKLEGANVRFTSDGQWYLQAQQTLAVTLPTGKTSPPGLSANDVAGGWGNRSELSNTGIGLAQVNLPLSKEKQTNAPLSSFQQLR